MLSAPYQNHSNNINPIVTIPHDQYSYINLLLDDVFEILGDRKTLWILPGGSMDLLLGIYKSRPDVIDGLNIHIVEVDESLYNIYSNLITDVDQFTTSKPEDKRLKYNVMSIYKLHSLLNKNNIRLELCNEPIDKYIGKLSGQDDDLVYINISTRDRGEEFQSEEILNTAYERLSLGLPTLVAGCSSLIMNRFLEGSSIHAKEIYVDKYLHGRKTQGLLTVHSYL